jgi:hypothetical protein
MNLRRFMPAPTLRRPHFNGSIDCLASRVRPPTPISAGQRRGCSNDRSLAAEPDVKSAMGLKANLFQCPGTCFSPSVTEGHGHAGSRERDPRAPKASALEQRAR